MISYIHMYVKQTTRCAICNVILCEDNEDQHVQHRINYGISSEIKGLLRGIPIYGLPDAEKEIYKDLKYIANKLRNPNLTTRKSNFYKQWYLEALCLFQKGVFDESDL